MTAREPAQSERQLLVSSSNRYANAKQLISNDLFLGRSAGQALLRVRPGSFCRVFADSPRVYALLCLRLYPQRL
jgi:hypothetical protein